MKGRRASYLNPVRMYVFTSAIFFLLFFSFFYSENDKVISINDIYGKTPDAIAKMDSATFAAFTANINKEEGQQAIPMSREEFKNHVDSTLGSAIHISGANYKTKKEYDSLLATGSVNDGWIERQLVYKQIALNEKYKNNPKEIGKAFKSALIHSLPQILFISLPLLALILKLLYIRRRKQFYYVSHGIFSLHLYIFLFIAMLFLFSLSALNKNLHWGILNFIFGVLTASLVVYTYLALKNFYQQGWIKTFFKFLLVIFLFAFVLGLLFVIFVFFSLFKI
jgi:Protein of unknown function (DUF3667)